MACPTCDRTMQNLGISNNNDKDRIFWCSYCGTLKTVTKTMDIMNDIIGIELPGMIRQIIKTADLDVPEQDKNQFTWVNMMFEVHQHNLGSPLIRTVTQDKKLVIIPGEDHAIRFDRR